MWKTSPAPDLCVIRAQIDTVWTTYSKAAVAGDADAIARLYTDSAYVVESGLPTIRGSSALRSAVKEVLGGVKFLESSIRPEITEIAGDRVLQFGTYNDVLQSSGKPVEVVIGRFAAVLLHDDLGKSVDAFCFCRSQTARPEDVLDVLHHIRLESPVSRFLQHLHPEADAGERRAQVVRNSGE